MRSTLHLLDDEMLAHFMGCEGGVPEHSLIEWAWNNYRDVTRHFIDVGAHVGTWAAPFSNAGMPTVAFEPNPDIWPLLEQSARKAVVWPLALSDRTGPATLTAPGEDGGMGSIVIDYGGPIRHQVHTHRLDDYDHLVPALIKIDAEGAELDVLRGAKQTIETHRPVIIFESWAMERGQRRGDLFRHLATLDYRVEAPPWPEMWIALPL